MLILGIETATEQVGCAIGGHEGVLASAHSLRGRQHAESLAPQIDFVRRQARIELSEISVVAVDVGPGLYTGLRVGVATAVATAFALGVPVIAVSSLDLVAFPVRFTPKLIMATLDARRGEVFYAFYRQVPGGIQRLSEPKVATPDEASSHLQARGGDCLLVGDGALRYRRVFEQNHRSDFVEQGFAHPSAGSLVQLAHAQALREEWINPWELRPLYLRKPDAEINWQSRERS
jgi:tRNA threonylcarbamoyladenosine biosynthesis protein TsaB